MAYITITDTWWTDGTNNEKTWTDEEIHKVGKYYVVNRGPDQRETGFENVAVRYRISWDVHNNKWLAERKYYDVRVPTNKMHWSEIRYSIDMKTDLKPHIPRKQKKKVYGNAVIAMQNDEEVQEVQLVQFHYKKHGCYYFKHKNNGHFDGKFRINANHRLEYKAISGWYETNTKPTRHNAAYNVVSIEIY